LLLQSELARTIAGQIDARIIPKEPSLPRAAPISSDAQDDYLRGRYNWDTRRQDELVKSVDYFERAIAKEPRYALAYAGLSDSLSVLSGRATGPDRKRLLDQAREAAKKAISLDDRLSDAHAGLAAVRGTELGRGTGVSTGAELSPGNSRPTGTPTLVCTGRVDEALIEARQPWS
jgi:hypothetical protein